MLLKALSADVVDDETVTDAAGWWRRCAGLHGRVNPHA